MSKPVVPTKKYRQYTLAFKQQAVARLTDCDNISALARELGVRRKFLYLWREQLAQHPAGSPRGRPPRAATAPPRVAAAALPPVPAVGDGAARRIAELERLVARQALELDFFRGALQRVSDAPPTSGAPGATASTSRSGSQRSSKAD